MSTVFILRRDPLAARRYQALFEAHPDFRVAGVTTSLFKANALLAHSNPDVLISDLGLEDGAAVSLVADLSRRYGRGRPRVLAISPSANDALLFATLCAGADTFMIENERPISPIDAVNRLLRGEAAVSPTLAEQILVFFGIPRTIARARGADERALDWMRGAHDPLCLSPGEQHMLALLAGGEASGSVALRLGVSVESVGRRLANICRKLQWDVHSGALALNAA